jgi:hypothetical protein
MEKLTHTMLSELLHVSQFAHACPYNAVPAITRRALLKRKLIEPAIGGGLTITTEGHNTLVYAGILHH